MAFSCEGILLGGTEAKPYLCLSPDQNKVVQFYLMLEALYGLDDMGEVHAEIITYITNWLATHNPNVAAAANTAALAAAAGDTRSAAELWAAAQALKLHCWPVAAMEAMMIVTSCYLCSGEGRQ